MTAGAVIGAARGHNTAVVRCGGMQCTPVGAVTGGAVAAGGEVLANRGASQAAVRIVTAGAAVVGVAGSTPQGVVMAVCTGSRCHLYQGAVIRGVGGMGRRPTVRMTGLTVAGRGLAGSRTDQAAVGVMTLGATGMG